QTMNRQERRRAVSDLNQAQRQNLSVVDDAPPTQPQSLSEAPTLQDVQGAEAMRLAGDRAVHEPSSANEFCEALTADSVAFLEKLRPGGPWALTAIVPDGRPTTITAKTPKEAQKFIRAHNGQRNLYFSVNPTRGILAKKAAKTDIATIEYV